MRQSQNAGDLSRLPERHLGTARDALPVSDFWHLRFGFVSDFGFRISRFI
jgi:hypothetical protein